MKSLFVLGHHLMDPNFIDNYNRIKKREWLSWEDLKIEQEKHLQQIVKFAFEYVPYYRRIFKSINISPSDIKSIEDLEKLPLLTKNIIRQNWEDMKPIQLSRIKYVVRNTGGTTGTPFSYRLDKHDRFIGAVLWYRGWGYGGYQLGDSTLFFGGSSLGVSTKSIIFKFANESVRNIKMISSFDMDDNKLSQYVEIINKYKPKFIYGYASAINYLARYIIDNNIKIHHPKALFSTSEKLYSSMRETINQGFYSDVYDTYGMNDGGVSAYECSRHSGLHIDTERSIMEVVGNDLTHLEGREGRIIATSLHNFSMPFLRYDTGDLGTLSEETCSCGRNNRLLKEVVGRSVDIFITPEGNRVHGWFFLYIFWEHGQNVKEYQVVQKTIEDILIRIVPGEKLDNKQINEIIKKIKMKSPGWHVEISYVDRIDRTKAGKFKFIISEVIND